MEKYMCSKQFGGGDLSVLVGSGYPVFETRLDRYPVYQNMAGSGFQNMVELNFLAAFLTKVIKYKLRY